MRVFVSYRRSDAGGHAGRLCDDIAERLDDAQVFQDVESIAPGEDFLDAVRRAVASADVVLVAVGPDWATAVGPNGGIRLAEPDDVVHLEVATALRSRKRVIPVLVGGASMPAAGTLPDDVAPLVRRQAVTVRPEAWDDDLERLVEVLAPNPAARRPVSRWLAGATVVLVAIVALLVIRDGDEQEASEPTASSTQPGAVAAVGAAGASPSNPSAQEGAAVELPGVARTILHPPSDDGIEFQVLETAVAQRSVRVVLRVANRGTSAAWLGESAVQLVADGVATNPREYLGAVEPRVDLDMALDFEVSAEPRELALALRYADEEGVIPLTPATGHPDPPALTTDIATADVGTSHFEVGPPAVDVLSDKFILAVPVQLASNSAYDVGFSDGDFRLLVDGHAGAPVGFLNELVAPGTSEMATLRWEVPFGAGSLVLRIEHQGAQEELPLDRG